MNKRIMLMSDWTEEDWEEYMAQFYPSQEDVLEEVQLAIKGAAEDESFN